MTAQIRLLASSVFLLVFQKEGCDCCNFSFGWMQRRIPKVRSSINVCTQATDLQFCSHSVPIAQIIVIVTYT
jgi:hypothetical protein